MTDSYWRDQVTTAERIATDAHATQLDKAGKPFIAHPRRVAARLRTEREQAVAWLHDVIEDTDWTPEALAAAGVDEQVIRSVLLLTRGANSDYYAATAQDPIARAVKLADIADNTDPARTALLDPATRERLAQKYESARRALGAETTREGASR